MIRLLRMNDTILTERQKKILVLLTNSKGLSRVQLEGKLQLTKSISRITLIRELNHLVTNGFVVQVGRGPATFYKLREQNNLLYYINLDEYFKKPSWQRESRKHFNPEIFNNLSSLFTDEEKIKLTSFSRVLEDKKGKLDPTIFKRELERFVIEFSWKSSQIEGNTYDLLEAETLIKQKIEAKGHSRQEAVMILNHKVAFDTILAGTFTFRTLDFKDITQLHNVLTKGLDITTGIRSQNVGISGTEYVPMAHKADVEKALRKTIQTINHSDFPPEKALIGASMIAYIQPFTDGNKRTARTLANAILIAHGYLPLSYRNIEVDEYKKALILFYEQNNLYHLKRIFIKQMQFSVENYFKTQ